MDTHASLVAASRDGHLALRRVERQQRLVELLTGGRRRTVGELAEDLGASTRTVERDVERLRDAGVPFNSRSGPGGGLALPTRTDPVKITFDTAEVAAIISSLATVGPNSSTSATSAIAKLVAALRPDGEVRRL